MHLSQHDSWTWRGEFENIILFGIVRGPERHQIGSFQLKDSWLIWYYAIVVWFVGNKNQISENNCYPTSHSCTCAFVIRLRVFDDSKSSRANAFLYHLKEIFVFSSSLGICDMWKKLAQTDMCFQSYGNLVIECFDYARETIEIVLTSNLRI